MNSFKFRLFGFAIFQLIVFSSIVIGQNSGWPSSAEDYFTLFPSDKQGDAQGDEVYRIAVIGDSIAWGNGLEQTEKYYYKVAKEIKDQLNMPVEVTVFAHSGAVISNPPSTLCTDLGCPSPTLMDQAKYIKDNVDLILVSGGINDVGIGNIVDANTPADIIESRSKSIEPLMTNLLTSLMGKTTAKIIVTGYYPLITDESKLDSGDRTLAQLVSLTSEKTKSRAQSVARIGEMDPTPYKGGTIMAAGLAMLENSANIIADMLTDNSKLTLNSYIFYSTSSDSLRSAVEKADNQENRIIFVDPLFSNANSYHASDTLLSDSILDPKSIAHPNDKGATIYADRIMMYFSDFEEAASASKKSSAAISDTTKRSYLDGYGNLVRQTLDGGYIIIGKIFFDKDKGGVWLIKTDANGNMIWDKTFGEDPNDEGHSIRQTTDGGYILAGYTNAGNNKDGWLIKTDSDGNMLWDRTFGDPEREESARSVRQTIDGGYIIAGYAESDSFPNRERWLVKTDADGNLLWEKTLGGGFGSYTDQSIQQTSDDGYILAGNTVINKPGQMPSQVPWLVKTDASGDVLWERTFEQSNVKSALSVLETTDGGYIVAGGFGADGLGLIRTDADGNMLWDRTFGESNAEINSLSLTADGGYIIAGAASGPDVWLAKTDADGNMLWDRIFGGSNIDWAQSVQQTDDNCYILAGYTVSDKTGKGMVWLIKVDANGNMLWDKTFGGTESE